MAFSVGALTAGLLGLLALAVTAARPEALAVGLVPACQATLAFAATTLPGLLPLLILAIAFITTRRLTVRGESGSWMALGLGPLDAWLSVRSLWIASMLVILVVGFAVEPWAWSTVHRFRGAPAASSAGWTRLTRGETIVLKDGGAAILTGEQLRFSVLDGGLEGSFDHPRPEPERVGWSFGPGDLRTTGTGGGHAPGRWRAERVEVQLSPGPRQLYLEPPSNPRTRSPLELLRATRDDGSTDRSRGRARFVLHRRLALALGAPLLALLGWLLGWSSSARARDGTRRSVLLVLLGLGFYGLTRSFDHAALAGSLPMGLAGWGPWWAALGALCVLWVARGRGTP